MSETVLERSIDLPETKIQDTTYGMGRLILNECVEVEQEDDGDPYPVSSHESQVQYCDKLYNLICQVAREIDQRGIEPDQQPLFQDPENPFRKQDIYGWWASEFYVADFYRYNKNGKPDKEEIFCARNFIEATKEGEDDKYEVEPYLRCVLYLDGKPYKVIEQTAETPVDTPEEANQKLESVCQYINDTILDPPEPNIQ